MDFINLTPHKVSFVDKKFCEFDDIVKGYKLREDVTAEKAIFRVIDPTGHIARVESKEKVVGEVAGVPIVKVLFGDVINLPSPTEGVVFIVSVICAKVAQRKDVLAPAQIVRDNSRQIVGCLSLTQG